MRAPAVIWLAFPVFLKSVWNLQPGARLRVLYFGENEQEKSMVRVPITDRPTANQNYSAVNEVEKMMNESVAAPLRSPASADDATEPSGDVPDPPVAPGVTPGEDGPTIPSSAPDATESDATMPPVTQPVDSARHENRTLGSLAEEVAGPGGADVIGGDLTPAQDAGQAMQENLDQRSAEQEIGRQQQGGEVETQTKDLKPHPSHPAEGLPSSPTGSENTGGANEGTSEEAAASAGDAAMGASASDVARAGADHDDRFLQLAADFENYKRQVTRREKEVRERAILSVLEDILPVLDNFELAVTHAKNAKDLDSVRIGVEHILQQLRNTLKSHGVEPLEAAGQKFDPLRHEALEEVAGSGAPEGTVVTETQRGYAFKGQVLRPSRVRVSNGQ